MLKKLTPFLTVLVFMAALLLAASPALAQTSGKANLECVTLEWQVQDQGNNVAVTVFLSGQKTDQFVLTPKRQFWDVNHRNGSCPMSGTFGLLPGPGKGHGKLEIAVVDEQGGKVYNHDGVLATW
ncbi:MAG: hypothetical protein K9K66_14285 [Desulfarculaceae bacterium]|nr:hypothetical protein [Desulfarculaceae bacterium]MCF8073841.1 hypothetical protein [Desulfarculaceae bacterium]MCF8102821.1 hypothetical protein [Desulfarculaceae bacterium]MCF8116265.1 hypothetical protein [Desulfarculaceae bacterium]